MELRERLQRLGYTSAAPAGTSPRPSAFPPPAVKPRTRSPWGVEAVVGGDEVESEHGRCFVARGEWDDEYRHGASAVGEYRSLPTGARGWLWRAARATLTDPGRVAFVDTETTGLAGGTGTYVFLVGVGRFVGGGFRLRQFFMRDYSEERPLLQALARELRDVDAVVTFNGKAFDVPLIETRYAMHRLPPPLQDADHLDLLFPARRLWRTRLDRCNLGTLESAVLGVSRDGLPDAPGWLIPTLYFEYVRSGDARPLRAVFSHNALDVLSMVGLTVRLARQFDDPFHAEWEHAEDLFGLGRAFEDMGEDERAALCYERALTLPLADAEHGRLLERIAALYRRLERLDGAAAIWQRLIDAGSGSLFPYVELAKHHEHRRRDPHTAARFVERALLLVQLRAMHDGSAADDARAALEHRLGRLRRKINGGNLTPQAPLPAREGACWRVRPLPLPIHAPPRPLGEGAGG